MNTFRHAGDIGDVIYSMPVVRAFGGGVLLLEAASYTRRPLIPENWCGIDLLLKQQPYISDVQQWPTGQPVTVNLNDFRANLFRSMKVNIHKDKHLMHWMCDAHGVPYKACDEPWISVAPKKAARVVFSRSGPGRERHHVYHNPLFPWHKVWSKYGSQAVFIGTESEHEAFCGTCGEVPHVKTANLLEAAEVISGCDLFVGNQSAPHAIAEAMKKRIVLEVWPDGPNCLVFRDGVTHGWDTKVKLPEL